MKQGFQGASGQMQLFLGNKSADVTLTRVVCNVPPQPAFSMHMAPVPAQLEPLKQVLSHCPTFSHNGHTPP